MLKTTREVRASRNDSVLAWSLSAPALLYIGIVLLVPCIWGVFISLTSKKIGSQGVFTGLENYIQLCSEKGFWNSVYVTLIFTFFAVLLKVVFGVILALLLNEKIRARGFFRGVLMLPWTLPILIAALTWRWMYSDVGGVLNYLLKLMNIIQKDINFLGTPLLAMTSVIIVNVWKGVPFIAMSVLAGLQTIPSELYESARMDGANGLRQFYHITVPLLKSSIMLSTLMSTIWTLNNFEGVWLLTAGGPAGSTQVLSIYSYLTAMSNNDIGKAMAVSVLSLPFLILLINAVARSSLKEER